MSAPQLSHMTQHDVHAELIGDLDYAAGLLADLDEAERDGNRDLARSARGQVGIVLDWMRDRLGHVAGRPCLFPLGSGYCIVEPEAVA